MIAGRPDFQAVDSLTTDLQRAGMKQRVMSASVFLCVQERRRAQAPLRRARRLRTLLLQLQLVLVVLLLQFVLLLLKLQFVLLLLMLQLLMLVLPAAPPAAIPVRASATAPATA